MSYALSALLQQALYDHLKQALPDVPVYDAIPPGKGAEDFILIGFEDVQDAGDYTGGGARHYVQLSVIGGKTGFMPLKKIAARLSSAMQGAAIPLAQGRVVYAAFQKARARRLMAGRQRRIDLFFIIRVEL